MPAPKKLLFLFSDTGGGHRSSCEAVEEAINHLYPDQFVIEKVDFLKYYTPWPFNTLPGLYPYMVMFQSRPWEFFFNLSNRPKTINKITGLFWPFIKPRFEKLFLDHPSDLIVSFHHMANHYLDLLNKNPKTVTVITDLITAHSAWYSGNPLKYFVPTQEIKTIGTKLGVNPNNIEITGLPVSLKFHPKFQISNFKFQIKTILLMGGGQGLGKLFSIAVSLNHSQLPIKLIVIAGRNPGLESKLKALDWKIPVEIYGFTKEIPALMQKSDILLTKAGPSTICEGLVSGLPIILYDYLRGQETASVDYLIKNHAGLYCPTPNEIIAALKSTNLKNLNTKSIATPDAALDIASGLYKLVS